MDKILDFFKRLKEEDEAPKELINKVISGLNTAGYDGEEVESWIQENLSTIERGYKKEFKKVEDVEN